MAGDSRPSRLASIPALAQNVGLMARVPPKYTDEDWDFNNKTKFRIMDDQQKLAERIVEESRRVADETKNTTTSWQREVEHQMKGRTEEIRFLVKELNMQKKTASLEDEALSTYIDRIRFSIDFLNAKSLQICQDCMILREGRIGVDLVDDEVDRQLRQELKVTRGCQSLLDKLYKEATEQLRKLRAAIYLLDKDLGQKDKSLLIDEANLTLRQTQQTVKTKTDLTNPTCAFSLSEWEHVTYQNINENAKQLNSATQLRAFVDLLLKQVVEDMQNQTNKTNEAFELRIGEMTKIKALLEKKHGDVAIHINEINKNLIQLKDDLTDREDALQLCLVRLSNRAQRAGLELTCDSVQDALLAEKANLDANIAKLKRKIVECNASLRYLLHVQIMQEEEINIKANSLKIDQVDCMTMREALKYSNF